MKMALTPMMMTCSRIIRTFLKHKLYVSSLTVNVLILFKIILVPAPAESLTLGKVRKVGLGAPGSVLSAAHLMNSVHLSYSPYAPSHTKNSEKVSISGSESPVDLSK